MATLIVRASVYGTAVGVYKGRPEPSRALSHVVQATLRLYGCPCEAIWLVFQLHPHEFGEIYVNGNLPLHIACTSDPDLLERYKENNAPKVIDILLYLHGSATTVPKRNVKLLIGLLIVSSSIWAERVGIVLRVNPTELLYEKIGLSGFQNIISTVAAEECLTFIFRFLRRYTYCCGTWGGGWDTKC